MLSLPERRDGCPQFCPDAVLTDESQLFTIHGIPSYAQSWCSDALKGVTSLAYRISVVGLPAQSGLEWFRSSALVRCSATVWLDLWLRG